MQERNDNMQERSKDEGGRGGRRKGDRDEEWPGRLVDEDKKYSRVVHLNREQVKCG